MKRITITVMPKWARGEEFKLQCTLIPGLGLMTAKISRRAVLKRGLNSNDMKSAGFYDNKTHFAKVV